VSGKETSSIKIYSGQRIAVPCLLVFLTIVVWGSGTWGQTTRPFDDEPLKSGSAPVRLATGEAAAVPASANVLDAGRVGLALVVVLVAIFLLRWLARQFVRVGVQESKPIKVLSRSVLSPKQQLLLLQVGKRLVVVGDSGGSMNPLCEISDPDEVATLIGQAREDRPITKSFGKFFGRAKEPFGEPDPPNTEEDAANPEIAEMSRDIGGLMEKVQSMRKQFKRS
jgi:flagellar biogenesis protein FliO